MGCLIYGNPVGLICQLVQHWSYMDRYEAELIARGPTFGEDGKTPTGSVHIVELPDPAAARAFAFDEPNHQAGVYRDVPLRRWRNLLGRTMWESPADGTAATGTSSSGWGQDPGRAPTSSYRPPGAMS